MDEHYAIFPIERIWVRLWITLENNVSCSIYVYIYIYIYKKDKLISLAMDDFELI